MKLDNFMGESTSINQLFLKDFSRGQQVVEDVPCFGLAEMFLQAALQNG